MCASSTFSLHLHSSCFLLFIFLHKGKNVEEQNQHMKTKTWDRKEGEAKGKGEEEGRRNRGRRGNLRKQGAFKSKGWKLVGLLFLKNDPCVVLLLRARYILFYLPEDTQRGALAQRKSATVSFKLHTLLFLMWFLTAVCYLHCKRLFWSNLVFL